jgi:hypothetical protein
MERRNRAVMGWTIHRQFSSGYRNDDPSRILGLHRLKKPGAALRKVPVGIGLLFELRSDLGIYLVSRQTFELALVLKVFGKSLHGRACRPSESRQAESYTLNRFGKTVTSGRVQTDRAG